LLFLILAYENRKSDINRSKRVLFLGTNKSVSLFGVEKEQIIYLELTFTNEKVYGVNKNREYIRLF